MKKIIILILILLAIVIVALANPTNTIAPSPEVTTTPEESSQTTQETPSEEAEEREPQLHTVSYTGEGFSPATITITAGDTVEFVNESGPDMWVASAQHPTHKIYPETSLLDCLGSAFDQCAATGVGTSWSFTFNQIGSWGYHNHARASDRGRIVVEE